MVVSNWQSFNSSRPITRDHAAKNFDKADSVQQTAFVCDFDGHLLTGKRFVLKASVEPAVFQFEPTDYPITDHHLPLITHCLPLTTYSRPPHNHSNTRAQAAPPYN